MGSNSEASAESLAPGHRARAKKVDLCTLRQQLPDVESHVAATTAVLVYITDENIE